MPLSARIACKNSVSASSPPADAPMPTTRKRGSLVVALGVSDQPPLLRGFRHLYRLADTLSGDSRGSESDFFFFAAMSGFLISRSASRGEESGRSASPRNAIGNAETGLRLPL